MCELLAVATTGDFRHLSWIPGALWVSVERRFAAAFREWGLDLDRVAVAEAAARISLVPPRLLPR